MPKRRPLDALTKAESIGPMPIPKLTLGMMPMPPGMAGASFGRGYRGEGMDTLGKVLSNKDISGFDMMDEIVKLLHYKAMNKGVDMAKDFWGSMTSKEK